MEYNTARLEMGDDRPKKPTPKKKDGQTFSERVRAERKAAFLAAFAEIGQVCKSADAAGVARTTPYDWAEADDEFAEAWSKARLKSVGRLEDEALRRAVDGTDKPVYQRGKKVGTVKEYSDTLLIFLLKNWRPERYREKREIVGAQGGPLKVVTEVAFVGTDESEGGDGCAT